MNKFMHPRNIYRTPPNFTQLALDFEEFRNAGKLVDFLSYEMSF